MSDACCARQHQPLQGARSLLRGLLRVFQARAWRRPVVLPDERL